MSDVRGVSTTSLLDRREFTLQLVIAVLSGATISVSSACGGGGGGPQGPSPGPSGNVSGTVTANHGHVATILAAQLTAGNAVQIDIRGDSDHPHTISLSADDVMRVAARQRVSVESTNDAAHAHTVIFNG